MSEARPLALIGFMASGKSTVGALVARRAGTCHRDLDAMIEAQAGMTIAELFASRGEAAFRELEAGLLPAVMEGGGVVSLGGGATLRDDSWALVRARALTVWLDAPPAVLLERAAGGEGRPLLGGRGAPHLEALLDARRPRYGEADHRVDADRPVEAVVEEVLRLWRG